MQPVNKHFNSSPASAGISPVGPSGIQDITGPQMGPIEGTPEAGTNVDAVEPCPEGYTDRNGSPNILTQGLKESQSQSSQGRPVRRSVLEEERLAERQKATGSQEPSVLQKRGRQETGTPPSPSESQKKRPGSEVTFSEANAGIELAMVPENFLEIQLDPQQGDPVI